MRGQFNGYRALDGVDPHSDVETFVALRVHVDSWRWAEVPFYIRAGKRLAVTATEVLVELQRPPRDVFGEGLRRAPEPRDVPARARREHLARRAHEAARETAWSGEDVELMAHHQPAEVMAPYERLLTDAMDGDPELFSRQDIVETSWRIVDPDPRRRHPDRALRPGLVGARGGRHPDQR